MASAEVRITSKFNSSGVDAAKNSLNKLEQTSKGATHNLSAGFQNIKLGNLNAGISQISSGLSGLSTALPVLGLAAAGIAGVAKAVSACVKEFAQAEVVNVRFSNSLSALGLSMYEKQFSNFASAMQKVSGVSDEVIKDAMQIGLQMGISANDIERVTKVAMDMSATFGTDLKTNIEMLAKAQEGQTTQLTRLLPNMKEAIKDGMAFSDVLGEIETRTNGAAAAAGGTFQGSMNNLKESFSELKEEIGESFAPTLKIIVDAIYAIIDGMVKLVKQANDLVEIQNTAAYQYLFLQKQQEIYNKAMAEGWIHDSVRVLAEIDKASKQIEKQVQQANEYQEKWAKTLQQQKEEEKKKKEEEEKKKKETQQKTDTSSANITTQTAIIETPTITISAPTMTATGLEHYYNKLQKVTDETFSDIDDNVLAQMEALEAQKRKAEEIEAMYGNIGKPNPPNIPEGSALTKDMMKALSKELKDEEDRKQKEKEDRREKVGDVFGIDLSSPMAALMSLLEQTKTFAMLGEVIQPIINMLDAVLMPVLQALAPVFTVLYESIAPILKLLIPPLIFVAALIANLVVAFKALLQTIWYVVTLQFSKIKTVKWTAMSMSQINEAVQNAMAGVDAAAAENPFGETTSSGTSTTYSASGARDIYVNIYYEHSYVNGDAREIALNIRNEIRLAEAMGL